MERGTRGGLAGRRAGRKEGNRVRREREQGDEKRGELTEGCCFAPAHLLHHVLPRTSAVRPPAFGRSQLRTQSPSGGRPTSPARARCGRGVPAAIGAHIPYGASSAGARGGRIGTRCAPRSSCEKRERGTS